MKDKENPIITVIIPARGRIEYVSQAIESVLNQRNFKTNRIQIIVVEDDPKREIKNTLQKKYPKILFIQNYDNEGPGGARNSGISKALGKYLAFLDSDDVWEPDFAAKMIKEVESDRSSVASLCFSNPFFEGDFTINEKLKLLSLCLVRDLVLICNYYANKHCLIRTGFYLPQISHMLFLKEKVVDIRFDYQYRRGGEDWAYFAECLKRGKIRMTTKRLLNFRYSKGSSTMQPINIKLKWESYQRVLDNLDNSFKVGLLHKLFLKYMEIGKKSI